jgi:cytochrome c biogenesis protein CcmG/thiol:disulfide interchange protein DsbE
MSRREAVEMNHSKADSAKVDLAIKGAIAALLVALGGVIVWSIEEHVVEVGDTATNFTITTTAGEKVSPKSFGGKVLVLNFWASWCAPCVEEAPSLNEFAKTLKDSGVVVLGVSVDKNDQQFENFVKRFDVLYPTARDPHQNLSYRYGTYKIPESYIIDRNGKVVRKFAGLPERDGQPISWMDPELVGFVKSLL